MDVYIVTGKINNMKLNCNLLKLKEDIGESFFDKFISLKNNDLIRLNFQGTDDLKKYSFNGRNNW